MKEETDRLKHDLQTIESALGMNLWTRRDVRRGLMGVAGGALAGLFLLIWSACHRPPVLGLIMLLALLVVIVIGKDIGFRLQPERAPGSGREIAFYNRFYVVGGALAACIYLWSQNRGMDPFTGFGLAIVTAGSWYLFYAISAPSRWISIGGALPLIVCGFLLPGASNISDAFYRLGIAMCAGCIAEGLLLWIALRPRPSAASGHATGGESPAPLSPNPVFPLHNATH
jgi:hypothetical protein